MLVPCSLTDSFFWRMIMKILVLDDEQSILDMVGGMLEKHGHKVDCAVDAVAAVGMTERKKYDMVLFDYRMPEKDGLWFLKNAKLPSETKAVLMTAYGNRKLINESFKLGAAGYLMKPFRGSDLLRHIEFHTSKKNGGKSEAKKA